MIPQTQRSTLFPYTTLFRSENLQRFNCLTGVRVEAEVKKIYAICGMSNSNNSSFDFDREKYKKFRQEQKIADRKSTRLNSSHSQISYAVFCLKKKKKINKIN